MQRLFERLRTTDAKLVHAELAEGFDWCAAMFVHLANSNRSIAVRQLVVP